MGKRGRSRREEKTPKKTSVHGGRSQQEPLAARLTKPRLDSSLSPPPGFVPSDVSPSPARYQTRNSMKAVPLLDQCNAILRSPIRNVKASYPSCASGDFPALLTTGMTDVTEENVDYPGHAKLEDQFIPTVHDVFGLVNQKLGEMLPSFPEVVVENNPPPRNADVVLNTNASGDFPALRTGGVIRATEENVNESVHSELRHQSVPTNHGVLGMENQNLGQQLQTVPSPPVVVVENIAPLNKAHVLNSNATGPETRSDDSGGRPTKSASNITRIAALMDDNDSDADEVGSRPDGITINGYRVKEESAPILQKIFCKYGDIAKNSSVSSVNISSSLLEYVCDICKKLEATDFRSIITSTLLQSMLAEVRDLEAVKVDVGWLSQRLNDISEAKELIREHGKLKEAKTRNLEVMETSKKKLAEWKKELAACYTTCCLLQENIRKEEHELGNADTENKRISKSHEDMKAKVNSFLKNSLVHDLL